MHTGTHIHVYASRILPTLKGDGQLPTTSQSLPKLFLSPITKIKVLKYHVLWNLISKQYSHHLGRTPRVSTCSLENKGWYIGLWMRTALSLCHCPSYCIWECQLMQILTGTEHSLTTITYHSPTILWWPTSTNQHATRLMTKFFCTTTHRHTYTDMHTQTNRPGTSAGYTR